MAQARIVRRKPKRRKPNFWQSMSLNDRLIALNVILFMLIWPLFFSERLGMIVLDFIALSPQLFVQGYVWTVVTSMFMHGGFGHLFVNMVSMFFIGNFVERLIGRKRYLWFYLLSGVVGGLMFVGLAYVGSYFGLAESIFGSVNSFAVGASGALFGLGGLLAVLIPRMKVLVMFVIPMPMWAAMAVLMFGLWAVSIASDLPVGNTAHFGGLLVGLIYGFYLRGKYPRKIRMLNKMFH